MSKLQIHEKLLIELPESFRKLSEEEIAERFPGKVDIDAYENASEHQNILFQWHKANFLLLAITDLNSMVKQNVKYTTEALSKNDFKVVKYIQGDLQQTNYIGYIAIMDVNGALRYMKSIFFKKKGYFQSVSFYKDDNDFSIFDPIIKSIQIG